MRRVRQALLVSADTVVTLGEFQRGGVCPAGQPNGNILWLAAVVVFDRFRLDPATGQVWCGNEVVRLSPKAGAVLAYLLAHPGQIVSQADLRQAVWPDTGGSAAALKVCIGELRKALGEKAARPRFIETLPRQGYRFIAAVTLSSSAIPSLQPVTLPPSQPSTNWSFPSSLVGRETELGQLEHAFDQALQGQRQIVFLSGEPGIGKTTVVEAFLGQLTAQSEAVWIAQGQCVEQYGVGEAYLPILEALGRFGQDADGQELIAVLAQYAPTWLAQLPALVAPAERTALQRILLGATRERMLREMAEALEMFTTRRPLVLVLEDLHWSDQSTLELLAYVMRRQGSARLFILATFRSTEVLSRGSALRPMVQDLPGRGHGEELQLGLLDEQQVVDYLSLRLGRDETPEQSFGELARWMYERTEGNPLFLVTMIEHLRQEGVITGTDGEWQIGTDWTSVTSRVPESLRQVIERQFEGLTTQEQRVLEVASVVGTEFGVAAVAAGSEQAIDTVEVQCAALAANGNFVREVGLEEWPDGTLSGRYRFLHALYQNVLYDQVPEVRRVQLHRQIAERKATAYGERVEEIAAELAVHYERGHDPKRAVQYRLQAARNAVRRGAHQEAVTQLSEGFTVVQTWPESAERIQVELQLQVALGGSLIMAKGYAAPEVEGAYARARQLCQQIGEVPELFWMLAGLYGFYLVRAELHTARPIAEQLLRLAQRTDDPLFLLIAHTACGQTAFFLGELSTAHEHFVQGTALYDFQKHNPYALGALEDPGVVCLAYAAPTLYLQGYPEQALGKSREALARAQHLAHPYSQALALSWALSIHRFQGDLPTVAEKTATLLTLATDQAFPFWLAQGVLSQGWLLAEQGQGEEGLQKIQQGLAAYHSTGAGIVRPYWLVSLAEACGKLGRETEGVQILTEALGLIQTTGERTWEAECHRLRGELLLSDERGTRNDERQKKTAKMSSVQHSSFSIHRFEEAGTCFRQALEIARQQEAKSLELRAALSLARLWRGQGKSDDARQILEESYDWFSEGFNTPDLQEAEAFLKSLGSTVRRKPAQDSPSPAPVELPQPILPREHQRELAPDPQPSSSAPSSSAVHHSSFIVHHSPVPPNLLRHEGEYWTLTFANQVCRVKDTRGMQYLAQLLSAPHREFLALDLVANQLAGTGLGTEDGGSGKAASPAERARVNVTRRLKAAIKKISQGHPELGQHLTSTIKTGAYCCYTPDARLPIRWQS